MGRREGGWVGSPESGAAGAGAVVVFVAGVGRGERALCAARPLRGLHGSAASKGGVGDVRTTRDDDSRTHTRGCLCLGPLGFELSNGPPWVGRAEVSNGQA